ncbi:MULTISPECIES: class I SAM-dependent methyltransferase [Halorussus]|uniref:class I SAM-dependent methyltransferase n=1 Tax=Halorussus TaxID=1070314 RepID=UPI0020A0545B|nr:class I SAM-dependent methyltransferase [Halorussus vallis]USZ75142.1 class I SAM-dependent methyltransferase [Halorussus vallis]
MDDSTDAGDSTDADDSERKRESMASFGAVADAYRESAVHREGSDLETLASWCADASRALDVACGAGHTAGALADAGVPDVVAADASPEMVRTAVESFGVSGSGAAGGSSELRSVGVGGTAADAERLPFEDDAFDAVTCRIAAHHFPDSQAFLAEVARVLAPGGTFAFEDIVAPEDDDLADFFDRFERLRDPTHAEAHSRSEWKRLFEAAGFDVAESLTMRKEMDYESWVERTGPDESARETLAELVRTPEAEAVYGVRVDGADGDVRGFGNRKVLIRARNGE